MERAGAGAARLILRDAARLRGRRVVVVSGRGNNGGDGFVVARHLAGRGARVEVYLVGRRGDVRGDAAAALRRWRGPVREIRDESGLPALERALARAHLVVDALLGTGLTGPAHGLGARVIEVISAAGRPGGLPRPALGPAVGFRRRARTERHRGAHLHLRRPQAQPPAPPGGGAGGAGERGRSGHPAGRGRARASARFSSRGPTSRRTSHRERATPTRGTTATCW